jgi:hypothetical protein
MLTGAFEGRLRDDVTWLLVPLAPETIDALAAFEAELEDAEDDDPAEEGADAEPSLGSLDAVANQERAWRVPTLLDLEYEGDNVADPDLEDGFDREWDPAENGIADQDGLREQGWGGDAGEPSLGATEDIDQRRSWRFQSDMTTITDAEAEGTIDDLIPPPRTLAQADAFHAAALEAQRRLRELVSARSATAATTR